MAQRLRFGIFEFDPATGELRREGALVRLAAQPAQVLGLLLAHSGEIVTREQLRHAVWGNGTFVDFDGSINYCVAQIRSALRDSAETPLYVRTIPKRGYQFLGPVETPSGPVANGPAAPGRPQAGRFKPRYALAALLVFAAGLGAAVAIERLRPVNIAVVRFDNETGNAEAARYADRLTDLVVADLASGAPRKFRVIGNASALREPRESRDLTKIGESLHAAYAIIGQVQQDGVRYRVLAHLIRLPEQTHLDVFRAERPLAEGLPSEQELGQQITARFLHRLGS